jgi:hypothetical protein
MVECPDCKARLVLYGPLNRFFKLDHYTCRHCVRDFIIKRPRNMMSAHVDRTANLAKKRPVADATGGIEPAGCAAIIKLYPIPNTPT